MTTRSFGSVVKKYFPHTETGYTTYNRELINTKPIEESYWLLMTRYVIDGTCGMNQKSQQRMIDGVSERSGLSGQYSYKLPTVLEASIGLASLHSKKWSAQSSSEWVGAYCEEEVSVMGSSTQVMISEIDSRGIHLSAPLFRSDEGV